ncbi:MAG: 50S ribosomal protein L16 [Candidatus Diapherotrites archaeon]|uniref:50S ribosomal protein L16 n=1 Tax=Candidatus Iainarchaeum sp. TaxID=3101447 RepID=A0A8T3YK41_9ARCH|nr:50S ribosomal protein L16 [Candidatus Diapherotrites archaeon]
MGLRPGHCYNTTKDRPYTRHAVTVHNRNYIGAVPGLRTRQFNMGDGMKQFDTIIDLIADTGPLGAQIRDNSLESARLMINRAMIKKVGKEGFFIKLRIYPHNILRENKQAQGAHADRIQKGMSHAFGKTIGRAARIRDGQVIFSSLVFEADAQKAMDAMLMAKSRFTCRVHVRVGKDVESIGTKPKKTRDLIKEEEEAKAAAATGAATEGAAAPAAEAGKEGAKGPAAGAAKAPAAAKADAKAAEKKPTKKEEAKK